VARPTHMLGTTAPRMNAITYSAVDRIAVKADSGYGTPSSARTAAAHTGSAATLSPEISKGSSGVSEDRL
jgi:hypothetical protein